MIFILTYICPDCWKVMKINGTECPYCAKARYSAIVDLARASVNSDIKISYICKKYATKFNSTNFYLVSKLKPTLIDSESNIPNKKTNSLRIILIIAIICMVVFLLLFSIF